MIPKARTENLSKAPPVNILKEPKIPPCWFEKNDLSAKSKIQYIEHIESRRKKLLEYKRIQTRLLEA